MKYSHLPQRNTCHTLEVGNCENCHLLCRENMSDNREAKIQFIFPERSNKQMGYKKQSWP